MTSMFLSALDPSQDDALSVAAALIAPTTDDLAVMRRDPLAAYQSLVFAPENLIFLPGAHVAVAVTPDVADVASMMLRIAGLPVRDTVVWMRPAGHRIVVIGRKPLAGTVADNVLQYGAGAINIDVSRVAMTAADRAETEAKNDHSNPEWEQRTRDHGRNVYGQDSRPMTSYDGSKGRFPSNLLVQHAEDCEPGPATFGQHLTWNCVEECPAAALDRQSGQRPGGNFPTQRTVKDGRATNFHFAKPTTGGARAMGDTGGASRFFRQFTADDADVWTWFANLLCPEDTTVVVDGLPPAVRFPSGVQVLGLDHVDVVS